MTTIKEQVRRALKDTEDTTDMLYCICAGERGSFDNLPEQEYDEGYGGTRGPEFIAYSPKYVYISVQYDGAEWIEAIPRHPEYVDRIPWPGS